MDLVTAGTLGTIALLGFLGKDRAIVTRKTADDPPRDDWDQPTGLRPSWLRKDALTESPYAASLVPVTEEFVAANLRLQAALRAYERALGAADKEQDGAVKAREKDARHWNREAGRRLVSLARKLPALAEDLRERGSLWDLTDAPQAETGTTTFEGLLDDSSLAWFYRLGVPVKALRSEVAPAPEGPQPVVAFARSLEAAAESSETYGRFLLRDSG